MVGDTKRRISEEFREDINENARSGRPSTSITDKNIEAVKKMILDNRRITIREVADGVSISFGSCQVICNDVLGMKRAAAKIVPKLLNLEQKQPSRCWRRSTTIQICSKKS